ncbi:MAG: MarP family serine protease [Candidatus Nanopelagicales bacterium]
MAAGGGTGMNLVDWILIGAVIVFAIAGWQRGFVSGALSFAGFLGGGLIGAFVLPPIVATTGLPDLARALIVAGGVLLLAITGQVIASMVGRMVRGTMTWKPVRVVDNAGGAVLNVLALGVVTWIVVSAVAYLPSSPVSQQLTASRVLVALDSVVPPPVRNAFGSLRDLVGSSDVPRIFSGFAQVTGPDVPPPDSDTDSGPIEAVRGSVLRVSGDTPDCSNGVTGSGFVVSAHRVITNAHVVAGVAEPVVGVRLGGPALPATVVYFDAGIDIAILDVPGLDAAAVPFALEPAQTGDSAVIAGFPGGGPYSVDPARVRTTVTARGDDIYGNAGVDREVYIVRGLVRPGNSGGPLLDPSGRALGVVFGSDGEEPDTGYALTAAQVAPAVEAARAATGPVDTGSCRLRD